MTEKIKQKLSEKKTSQLINIVLAALDIMDESEQIEFIARHIDAGASLAYIGEDNPEMFLEEVERFCLDCLNDAYYSDEDDIEEYFNNHDYDNCYYDDEWDYDEYFSNTEWAETFTRLFKLSMMYIQSENIDTGYEAMARLLSCLNEMMRDEEHLGTDEPMSYIAVEWEELFPLYYSALFRRRTDAENAIGKAFRCWKNFGIDCTEAFLSNVKDVTIAERIILDEIKKSQYWSEQRDCFILLVQLYERLGKEFDKSSHAKALTDSNVNFYRFVVDGLYEKSELQSVIETANVALELIPTPSEITDWRKKRTQQEIRIAIQTKLVCAYEDLGNFTSAYGIAMEMFRETPDFGFYLRVRALAEKSQNILGFLSRIEERLSGKQLSYPEGDLLRSIYSYEGEVQKLLSKAKSKKIENNYYDRKYIALSLIYRAANGRAGIGEKLSEYLAVGSAQDGIGNMLINSTDTTTQTELLLHGADLLRGIITFHINAANRNRYAKAAYYMCVMRDIYRFMEKEDEFRDYFNGIILQNNRRPALRDEMSVVYGKEATQLKR